ncbi:29062_t:CDS:2 [Gigaspora margarita]|uniref:29062_t:CDS:1 n=1 Tax=Gigaspora margarita TaxID=4874 RepID=A0ABM8VVT1_GIGMA|nr:29062_t:CDS:2 [Gigaspora margarita]
MMMLEIGVINFSLRLCCRFRRPASDEQIDAFIKKNNLALYPFEEYFRLSFEQAKELANGGISCLAMFKDDKKIATYNHPLLKRLCNRSKDDPNLANRLLGITKFVDEKLLIIVETTKDGSLSYEIHPGAIYKRRKLKLISINNLSIFENYCNNFEEIKELSNEAKYKILKNCIDEHKNKSTDRGKLFEIFCTFSKLEVGKDDILSKTRLLAKYWVAYYCACKGYDNKKEKSNALTLYKEVFNNLNKESYHKTRAEAQVNYVNLLFKRGGMTEGEKREAVEYLTSSIEAGNDMAQCHLGEIYCNGKLGVEKDQAKSKNYFKLSAYQKYQKAIEKCNKLGIQYN